MSKNKILIGLMIIIAVMLCIPSITYLINNKTVDEFGSYYTYTLNGYGGEVKGIFEGILVIGLVILFGIIYLLVIKDRKEIFKTNKQVIILIIIISCLFMCILPFLSSDIYYYIGDSWIDAEYGENPYYVSVKDLQDIGINDEILKNTGYWYNTTSVYGPLWNFIAKILVTFSFGNVTIALFIFKLASLFIHIINCYLIYKITKDIKYVLLYGLNPLILIEFLSNVHNDIYLILFILIALYFLVQKNNKILTLIFLALSISVKYSTVLIVPFILIYMYKDKSLSKKIGYCIISGLSIIGIVIALYLPYYRDMSIFSNMLVQGTKYSQSIILFIMKTHTERNIFNLINKLAIPIFAIVYINTIIILLFKKDISIKEIFSKYNYIMLIFIFIVLTNFQQWYILWLIPTIMWQSLNMRKFIIYLSITAIIPSFNYFRIGTDAWIFGIGYSLAIIIMSSVILCIDVIINKYIQDNSQKKINLNDIV